MVEVASELSSTEKSVRLSGRLRMRSFLAPSQSVSAEEEWMCHRSSTCSDVLGVIDHESGIDEREKMAGEWHDRQD